MSEPATGLTVGLLVTAVIFGPMLYVWNCEDRGLPRDPRGWRTALQARRMREAQKRIGLLEHDLGYTPCSDPECFTCGMERRRAEVDVRRFTRGRGRPPADERGSPMSEPRWKCDVCGATGTAKTVKAARAELAHHYGSHHNDPDF